MPAAVFPPLLLCGLFVPRRSMQTVRAHVCDVLPMSYAVDAMTRVSTTAGFGADLASDLAVVAGCAVAVLALGAVTLRRRTR